MHCFVSANTWICRCGPADKASIQEIESVQNRTIRFVKNIKGCHGLTVGQTTLGLEELKDRRKLLRLTLLTRILSEENKHPALCLFHDDIVNSRNQASMIAHAATWGEFTSVYTNLHACYNSFLSKTVRDLRINPHSWSWISTMLGFCYLVYLQYETHELHCLNVQGCFFRVS